MALTPYTAGFRCLDAICDAQSMPLAAVNVAKGDILVDNGSGYLTNASITAFVETNKYYVALEPVDNSGGSAGDLNILCQYCDDKLKWVVPNESGTVAAQTDVGEVVDLESEDGIDVTDTTVKGMGFLIEAIDISTAAIAAAAGGFVKGRFVVEGDQA